MIAEGYSGKLIISLVLLILIIIVGIVLHKTGKPYNTLLFNLHKLASVALVVIIVLLSVKYFKEIDAGLLFYIILGFSSVSFIVLFISGAMMSLDRMHEIMRIIHIISTILEIISFSLIIYLITRNLV